MIMDVGAVCRRQQDKQTEHLRENNHKNENIESKNQF